MPQHRPQRAADAARAGSAVFLLCLLPGLLAVAGCGSRQASERLLYAFRGQSMGTYYVVKVVRPSAEPLDDAAQEELQGVIEGELDAVDAAMSTWRDDSELTAFNRHAGTEPFEVSAATFEVVSAALEISRRTGGAFDVTVAPLVAAYGFGADGDAGMPSDDELEALRRRVGVDLLGLDAEARTLTKAVPELSVDLSGIAKGYAIDRVVAGLGERGLGDVFVEVGGEVRAVGVNLEGRPWRLGIERPDPGVGVGAGVQRLLDLGTGAVATSGDYRNYHEVDGERLSHLIDPRTGRPVDHRLASVTVVRDTCMEADALATAFMILGADEGLELARRDDVAALFLVREGDGFVERSTPAFDARFEPLSLPVKG